MSRLALALALLGTACAGSTPAVNAPSSDCSDLVQSAQKAVSKLAQARSLERRGDELNTQLGLLSLPESQCARPTVERPAAFLWMVSTFERWSPCQLLETEAVRTIRDVASEGNTLALYHGGIAVDDVRAVFEKCNRAYTVRLDPSPYMAAVRARTLLAMGIVPSGQIKATDPFENEEWINSVLAGTRNFWLDFSRNGLVSVNREWPLRQQCAGDKSKPSFFLEGGSSSNCLEDVTLFEEQFDRSVQAALGDDVSLTHLRASSDYRHRLEAFAEGARDIRVRFVAFVRLGDLLLGDGDVGNANAMYVRAVEPAQDEHALQLLKHHPDFEAVRRRVIGVAVTTPEASASTKP